MERNHAEQARILAQLESVEARYEELSIRITLPEVIADTQLFAKLMREHSDLSELNGIAKNCRALAAQLDEAHELLNDPDMADMAREEVDELEPKLREALHAARVAMLPKDRTTARTPCWKCAPGRAATRRGCLAPSFCACTSTTADRQGWKWELIEGRLHGAGRHQGERGPHLRKNVFEKLKFESGVHRVQRVPVTESSGRIHTSTATVAVLPEAEDVELEINPNDLRIDTYRASGAGGQHVNRTDLRRAHHPHPHGAGGDFAGPALADTEPRKGHARAQIAPL